MREQPSTNTMKMINSHTFAAVGERGNIDAARHDVAAENKEHE